MCDRLIKLIGLDMLFSLTGTNLKSGGVPPVIFQLKNLQELYLDNQGIQAISADIENLSNLRVLSLTHCLMLQSIAAPLGLNPNLKSMCSCLYFSAEYLDTSVFVKDFFMST